MIYQLSDGWPSILANELGLAHYWYTHWLGLEGHSWKELLERFRSVQGRCLQSCDSGCADLDLAHHLAVPILKLGSARYWQSGPQYTTISLSQLAQTHHESISQPSAKSCHRNSDSRAASHWLHRPKLPSHNQATCSSNLSGCCCY